MGQSPPVIQKWRRQPSDSSLYSTNIVENDDIQSGIPWYSNQNLSPSWKNPRVEAISPCHQQISSDRTRGASDDDLQIPDISLLGFDSNSSTTNSLTGTGSDDDPQWDFPRAMNFGHTMDDDASLARIKTVNNINHSSSVQDNTRHDFIPSRGTRIRKRHSRSKVCPSPVGMNKCFHFPQTRKSIEKLASPAGKISRRNDFLKGKKSCSQTFDSLELKDGIEDENGFGWYHGFESFEGKSDLIAGNYYEDSLDKNGKNLDDPHYGKTAHASRHMDGTWTSPHQMYPKLGGAVDDSDAASSKTPAVAILHSKNRHPSLLNFSGEFENTVELYDRATWRMFHRIQEARKVPAIPNFQGDRIGHLNVRSREDLKRSESTHSLTMCNKMSEEDLFALDFDR